MMNKMNMIKDEITKNPCNRIGEFNNFCWISESFIIISLLPSPMVVKSFLRELSQYEQNMPLKICVPSQRTSLALSSQDSNRKSPCLNIILHLYSDSLDEFDEWRENHSCSWLQWSASWMVENSTHRIFATWWSLRTPNWEFWCKWPGSSWIVAWWLMELSGYEKT